MSDRSHRKQRPTFPEGYQYGDARKKVERTLSIFVPTSLGFCIQLPWRAPHENAAEQLKRRADAGIFKIGEPSNAGHLPQRFKVQRTGDETL